jgi:hypothetical protein
MLSLSDVSIFNHQVSLGYGDTREDKAFSLFLPA